MTPKIVKIIEGKNVVHLPVLSLATVANVAINCRWLGSFGPYFARH